LPSRFSRSRTRSLRADASRQNSKRNDGQDSSSRGAVLKIGEALFWTRRGWDIASDSIGVRQAQQDRCGRRGGDRRGGDAAEHAFCRGEVGRSTGVWLPEPDRKLYFFGFFAGGGWSPLALGCEAFGFGGSGFLGLPLLSYRTSPQACTPDASSTFGRRLQARTCKIVRLETPDCSRTGCSRRRKRRHSSRSTDKQHRQTRRSLSLRSPIAISDR
jgi:hypothetical protein